MKGFQLLCLALFLLFLFAHYLHQETCHCAFMLTYRFENVTKCRNLGFYVHLQTQILLDKLYPSLKHVIRYESCDCHWQTHLAISFVELFGGAAIIARWKRSR